MPASHAWHLLCMIITREHWLSLYVNNQVQSGTIRYISSVLDVSKRRAPETPGREI